MRFCHLGVQPSIMVHLCVIIGCSSQGGRTLKLTTKTRAFWLFQARKLSVHAECVPHFIKGEQALLNGATDPDCNPTLKIGHGKEKVASSLRYEGPVERETKKRKLQTKEVIQEYENIDTTSTGFC